MKINKQALEATLKVPVEKWVDSMPDSRQPMAIEGIGIMHMMAHLQRDAGKANNRMPEAIRVGIMEDMKRNLESMLMQAALSGVEERYDGEPEDIMAEALSMLNTDLTEAALRLVSVYRAIIAKEAIHGEGC